MKQVINIGKHRIGSKYPVYIISEIGSNFDGDLKRAKYLAKLSLEAGATAFKIQNFNAPQIVSKRGFQNLKISFQSKWQKTVFDIYKNAEFPRKWLKELSDYCKKIGIDFFSSPYDKEAVDLLEKIFVPAHKVGSGEIDNLDFLQYVAQTMKPIIIACGASTINEIETAISTIRNVGNNQIILLQCVTNYPSKIQDANIKAMVALKEKFNVEIGYSDHTTGKVSGGDDPLDGLTVPLAAVALGAKVIEKHFTDDRTRKGPDHPFAMEFKDFKKMVLAIRALETAMGDGIKKVMSSEKDTAIIQRRGIYAKKDIRKGNKIKLNMIEFLRPAIGLRPCEVSKIEGKKAKQDIPAGSPLTIDDISS